MTKLPFFAIIRARSAPPRLFLIFRMPAASSGSSCFAGGSAVRSANAPPHFECGGARFEDEPD